MTVDRSAFDEAVANMAMEASPFYREYVFYMHLLSQCKVVFNTSLPSPAGVTFNKFFYTLYINPSEVVAEGIDMQGKEIKVPGFTMDMPLEQRIGILKHEMLHIALGHLFRVQDGDKDFKKYNFASDCALNQQIDRSHLPDGAIYPDNLPTKEKNVISKETAEYYYDILDDDQMQGNGQGNGSGEGDGNGEGGIPGIGKGFTGVDDHSSWLESEGDPELQQEITKNMVEKSANETQKSRGNLPANYSDIIDNLILKREVDWRQVLRKIVGNKRANSRKTLLRRDRRLPYANWIKGRTKDRVFDLGVISDVSGSVSDSALMELWGEIVNICDTYKVPVQMVQVDTQPTEPQQLTKDCRSIERKACGGTYLSPAIEKFKEAGVNYDALVVTTDGYLFGNDIDPFRELKVPVIWLIEAGGHIMDEMNEGRMQAIQLKGDKD